MPLIRGRARLKVEQTCLPPQIRVTSITKPDNSSGNEKLKAIPYHHIPQSTCLEIICWKPVSEKVSACSIFVGTTSSALVLKIRSMLLLYLHAEAWNQTPTIFYKFCLTTQYLCFVRVLCPSHWNRQALIIITLKLKTRHKVGPRRFCWAKVN